MDAVKRSKVFDTPRHKLWRRNFNRFLREYDLTTSFKKISVVLRARNAYRFDIMDQWFYFFEADIKRHSVIYHNNIISTIWSTFDTVCREKDFMNKVWEMSDEDITRFSTFSVSMLMVILFMHEVMMPIYDINNALQCELEGFLIRTRTDKNYLQSEKLKNIIADFNEKWKKSDF